MRMRTRRTRRRRRRRHRHRRRCSNFSKHSRRSRRSVYSSSNRRNRSSRYRHSYRCSCASCRHRTKPSHSAARASSRSLCFSHRLRLLPRRSRCRASSARVIPSSEKQLARAGEGRGGAAIPHNAARWYASRRHGPRRWPPIQCGRRLGVAWNSSVLVSLATHYLGRPQPAGGPIFETFFGVCLYVLHASHSSVHIVFAE